MRFTTNELGTGTAALNCLFFARYMSMHAALRLINTDAGSQCETALSLVVIRSCEDGTSE